MANLSNGQAKARWSGDRLSNDFSHERFTKPALATLLPTPDGGAFAAQSSAALPRPHH